MLNRLIRPFLLILRGFADECAALGRSRGALSLFVAGIVFYSLLYPQPYLHETPQKLPFAAVDRDRGAASRALLRALGATEGLRLHHAESAAEAASALRAGLIAGYLVVPGDFERRLLRGEDNAIPLYCDAAHLLLYRTVLQGARQAAESVGAGARLVRLEKAGAPGYAAAALQSRGRFDARVLYNPAGRYNANTVPPVFVLIIQQILIAGCAMSAARGRELFPSSATSPAALFGRLLPPLALAQVFALYYLRVLPGPDDLPRAARFGDLLLFLLPFFLACATLGRLGGRFLRAEWQALAVILPTSLPLLFLSGFVWPPEAMPGPFRALAQLCPGTPAITGALLMAVHGAGFAELLPLWARLWGLFFMSFAALCLATAEDAGHGRPRPNAAH